MFFHEHKDKVITEEAWNEIYFPKLKNQHFLSVSEKFWLLVYKQNSNGNKIKYLILSLLLMCGKLPSHETSFKKVLYNLKLHNLENNEIKKNDVKTVKKSVLYDVIKTYIDIISYQSVEIPHLFQPEENNYVEELKIKYSSENQKEIMERLFRNCNDNINIDDFFKKNSALLHNKIVREELHNLYITKYT